MASSFHLVALLSIYLLAVATLSFGDGDLCSQIECKNGGTCVTDNVTYMCRCAGCYIGTYCELDPCTDEGDNPCFNGGTCFYDETGPNKCQPYCRCRNGFMGGQCQNSDPCAAFPCRNNGTCHTINATDFHCTCKDGWSGQYCTTPPSTTPSSHPCQPNPCLNGGVCYTSGSTYGCDCPWPFSGSDCSTAMCSPPTNIILDAVNGTWKEFSSPYFPMLVDGLNCRWVVRAPPGQNVEIAIQNVTLTGGTSGTFEAFDPATNGPLFETHASTNSGPTVKSHGALAEVFFDTRQRVSGSFFLQYQAVAADPCATYTCENGGICVAVGFTPQCKCVGCWHGPHCDDSIENPCDEPPYNTACGSHGTCEIDANCQNPQCKCDPGFNPPFCRPPVHLP